MFCCIWAFGSTLFKDQLTDWRKEFSKWWVATFKTIKLPAGDSVFNFYIENEYKKLLPWDQMVRSFDLDPDIPLQVYDIKYNF